MDKYSLYQVWAPEESPWSSWVKPALFAHYSKSGGGGALPNHPASSWLPAAAADVALIVELPGAEAVTYGLELARRGSRPVPVFASCPPDSLTDDPCLVDASAILAALAEAALLLPSIQLPGEAPPAFLLDSHRMAVGKAILESTFDNRSAVFASDFPSASILRSNGVQRCLIVRDPAVVDGGDLARALLPWRREGIDVVALDLSGQPLAWQWPPDGFWPALWHRIRLRFLLSPNPHGGYGRFPFGSGSSG